MRPVVVASSFSTTSRWAGCSVYSRNPSLSSKRAKMPWVWPPERPEKSSPTERSMVLGTSSFRARIDDRRSSTSSRGACSLILKNTRWSTISPFPFWPSCREKSSRSVGTTAARSAVKPGVWPARSGVEVAHPAVGLELLDLIFGQSAAVPDGHVALHVGHRAYAGNHGRDGGVAENVAQGYLRYLVLGNPELRGHRSHPIVHVPFAVAPEVVVPEVALVEGCIRRDTSGQGTLVERNPDYDPDAVLLTDGQQPVLRALVEDVVDHLHRVDHARLDEPDGVLGLVVVYGDAEKADLAVPLEFVDGLQPVPASDPVVLPNVELLHVQGVEPEVSQALLGALPDVVPGEHLPHRNAVGGRPDPVFRRDLRGDVYPLAALREDLAHEALALSPAV